MKRSCVRDLKEGGVEFQPYAGVPHLLCPPIVNVDDIPAVFARLELLMKERGAVFNQMGVRDIVEYNSQVEAAKRFSHVFVLFDEYASIMHPRKRKLGHIIQGLTNQLLQKGRAFGMHVVICTQYPNVDVVASIGKANIMTRVCGYFPLKTYSLAVFDSGIAAELPRVPGRMAALFGGKLITVQSPHVSTEYVKETVRLVSGAAEQTAPVFGTVVSEEVPLVSGLLPELSEQQAADAAMLVRADQPVVLALEDQLRMAQVALEQLDGVLTARRVWERLKDQYSLAQVQEVLAALLTDGRIEVNGVMYVVVRQPRGGKAGYMLVPEQGHELELPIEAIDLSELMGSDLVQ